MTEENSMGDELEFKMVQAGTPEALEQGVTDMIRLGWSLHGVTMMSTEAGGPTGATYVQALIKVPSRSRHAAADDVIGWLDDTVGVGVSQHVGREDVDVLLDKLGWPADDTSDMEARLHRDHPDLVESMKESMEHPENRVTRPPRPN